MEAQLIMSHDAIGDILMVGKCKPYRGQGEDTIDDCVVCRFNAKTGEIENTEIIFFKALMERDGAVTLPMEAIFWLTDDVAVPEGNVNGPEESEYVPGHPESKLKFAYSAEADTLQLSKCPLDDGQTKVALDDLADARLNPETREIEHLEIRRFYRRLENKGEIRLPIHAWLRSTEETFPAPLPIPANT